MAFHYDPEAEKRSLMLQQKALCNGQKTGRACAHYWAHVEKVESANPDFLRRGEIFRACAFVGGGTIHCHEMAADQLSTECNQYKARVLPIWKRPLAALRIIDDPGAYDPFFEGYDPMTSEDIAEQNRLHPSTPEDTTATVGTDPAAEMAADNVVTFQKELSLDDAMDALDDKENTDA
jgi:hypothetical protein